MFDIIVMRLVMPCTFVVFPFDMNIIENTVKINSSESLVPIQFNIFSLKNLSPNFLLISKQKCLSCRRFYLFSYLKDLMMVTSVVVILLCRSLWQLSSFRWVSQTRTLKP